MHYLDADGHGFEFDPFKAIVAPRPIGWISTLDGEGRPNLAPYSFFNAVASRPNMIAFSSEGLKHSMTHARATGEFVFNLATRKLVDGMNQSSFTYPDGVNEFAESGLEMAPSLAVKPPRVADAAAALECRVVHQLDLVGLDGKPTDAYLVIGQVVATYIDDVYLKDGRFDAVAAGTIARCGYRDYAQVTDMFELLRPTDGGVFRG